MVDPAVDELPPWRLATQRRWVRSSGLALGLAAEVSERTAEVVARLLGVAGTAHERARREWAEARDIRARSLAVVSILALVALDAAVVARLLGVGSVTGALGAGIDLGAGSAAADVPERRNGRSRPGPVPASAALRNWFSLISQSLPTHAASRIMPRGRRKGAGEQGQLVDNAA